MINHDIILSSDQTPWERAPSSGSGGYTQIKSSSSSYNEIFFLGALSNGLTGQPLPIQVTVQFLSPLNVYLKIDRIQYLHAQKNVFQLEGSSYTPTFNAQLEFTALGGFVSDNIFNLYLSHGTAVALKPLVTEGPLTITNNNFNFARNTNPQNSIGILLRQSSPNSTVTVASNNFKIGQITIPNYLESVLPNNPKQIGIAFSGNIQATIVDNNFHGFDGISIINQVENSTQQYTATLKNNSSY
jgi:hypothetical protein